MSAAAIITTQVSSLCGRFVCMESANMVSVKCKICGWVRNYSKKNPLPPRCVTALKKHRSSHETFDDFVTRTEREGI